MNIKRLNWLHYHQDCWHSWCLLRNISVQVCLHLGESSYLRYLSLLMLVWVMPRMDVYLTISRRCARVKFVFCHLGNDGHKQPLVRLLVSMFILSLGLGMDISKPCYRRAIFLEMRGLNSFHANHVPYIWAFLNVMKNGSSSCTCMATFPWTVLSEATRQHWTSNSCNVMDYMTWSTLWHFSSKTVTY